MFVRDCRCGNSLLLVVLLACLFVCGRSLVVARCALLSFVVCLCGLMFFVGALTCAV